jgi:hypothetical protein
MATLRAPACYFPRRIHLHIIQLIEYIGYALAIYTYVGLSERHAADHTLELLACYVCDSDDTGSPPSPGFVIYVSQSPNLVNIRLC